MAVYNMYLFRVRSDGSSSIVNLENELKEIANEIGIGYIQETRSDYISTPPIYFFSKKDAKKVIKRIGGEDEDVNLEIYSQKIEMVST